MYVSKNEATLIYKLTLYLNLNIPAKSSFSRCIIIKGANILSRNI